MQPTKIITDILTYMHTSKCTHCDRKLTNRVGTAAKTRPVNATEVCRNNNKTFHSIQIEREIQGTYIKDFKHNSSISFFNTVISCCFSL